MSVISYICNTFLCRKIDYRKQLLNTENRPKSESCHSEDIEEDSPVAIEKPDIAGDMEANTEQKLPWAEQTSLPGRTRKRKWQRKFKSDDIERACSPLTLFTANPVKRMLEDVPIHVERINNMYTPSSEVLSTQHITDIASSVDKNDVLPRNKMNVTDIASDILKLNDTSSYQEQPLIHALRTSAKVLVDKSECESKNASAIFVDLQKSFQELAKDHMLEREQKYTQGKECVMNRWHKVDEIIDVGNTLELPTLHRMKQSTSDSRSFLTGCLHCAEINMYFCNLTCDSFLWTDTDPEVKHTSIDLITIDDCLMAAVVRLPIEELFISTVTATCMWQNKLIYVAIVDDPCLYEIVESLEERKLAILSFNPNQVNYNSCNLYITKYYTQCEEGVPFDIQSQNRTSLQDGQRHSIASCPIFISEIISAPLYNMSVIYWTVFEMTGIVAAEMPVISAHNDIPLNSDMFVIYCLETTETTFFEIACEFEQPPCEIIACNEHVYVQLTQLMIDGTYSRTWYAPELNISVSWISIQFENEYPAACGITLAQDPILCSEVIALAFGDDDYTLSRTRTEEDPISPLPSDSCSSDRISEISSRADASSISLQSPDFDLEFTHTSDVNNNSCQVREETNFPRCKSADIMIHSGNTRTMQSPEFVAMLDPISDIDTSISLEAIASSYSFDAGKSLSNIAESSDK